MKLGMYRCDCCGKTVNDAIELTIPILHVGVDDKEYASPNDVDVCEECAGRFLDLYYQIAREHHFSGIRAIDMGEDS